MNNTTSGVSPYSTVYEDNRVQYLYLASELTALGATAGNLNSIAFNITTIGSPTPANVNIKVAAVAAGTTTLTALVTTGLTTVYTAASVTPVTGWNTYTFSSPWSWNGTSNILIEVCRDNTSWSGNYGVQTTQLAAGLFRTYGLYDDGVAGCSMTGATLMTNADRRQRPNMRFDIASVAPCAGTPTAGTVPATVTTCPGATAIISATGATTGTGISYQWEEFVSGSWGAVSGGSGAGTTTYTTTAINSARQFRLRVTCSNGGGTATTTASTASPLLAPVCYCAGVLPTFDFDDDGTGLRNVTFNTINNTSAGGPAYTDFTAVQTTVNAGGAYPLSVSVNTAGDFLVTATAWIDWNQNAVFEVGEEYGMGTAQNGNPLLTSLSPRTITVPINALGGSTIMRVRATYFDAPTACGAQDYTEAEDYRINVVACTPPTANMSVVNDCGNNQFSVAVNVTGLGSGSQANIVYTVNGGAPTTLSNVGLGTTNIGPFASTAVVTAFVNNGPVACATGTSTFYSGCPIPIVCGNTVVFRASEASPRTHMLVAEALVEAGLPPGVLNVVTNAPQDAPEVIDALIAHKAVRRINFTGSTRVGRIIAQKAATQLKRCLLELGGKSPLVVLDDANVDEAVKAAVFGSFLYQGQICMSTERIVVDEAIADDFVAKFAAKAMELPAGDPTKNAACVIGPMVAKESGPRLNALIDDALAKGAKLATGGHADGALMPATIVDHVKPGMKIYDEETFGPITTVVRVKGVEEAVSVANDTAYGLSAGVFGRDVTRALGVALQVDCGSVHVNGATVQNEAQAPYGGMKDSGYGRFDGRAVIDEFTELKWITLEPSVQQYPV